MIKTIREWMSYYSERYGRHYRVIIEDEEGNHYTYYWWEYRKMGNDILDSTAKRVWSRPYVDEHGIQERELKFVY